MAFCMSCGNDAGENRFCTRCGAPAGMAPARAAAYAPAPAKASNTGVILAVVVGGGFLVVMMVGVLAAIAIPKFSSVSRGAKEAEARPLLRQLHALEQSHRAQNGTFTANLEAPEEENFLAGWSDPGARYYRVSVSTATESALCIDATATEAGAAADVSEFSMDQDGTMYEGPGCVLPLAPDEEPVDFTEVPAPTPVEEADTMEMPYFPAAPDAPVAPEAP